MVGAIAIISAFSKSVKEAGTAVMPLMIVVMILSLTTMMGGDAKPARYLYFIPLYNSVQCMNGIFSMDYHMINIIITIAADFLYAGILAAVLTKIFDSEKIMNMR